jgi:hypothetical protein
MTGAISERPNEGSARVMTLVPHLEACRVRHGETPEGHTITVTIPSGGAPRMPAELADDAEGRIAFAVANWELGEDHAGRRIIRVDEPCCNTPSTRGLPRWEIESAPAA